MANLKKATIERLRTLDILTRSNEVPMTYQGSDDRFRAAMAGEPVLKPIELFIYMGGNPDNFGQMQASDCVAALRKFGYKPDRAAVQFGEKLSRVWIRTEVWPEDQYWDEQVKLARREALVTIGLMDILDDEDD
jgi:hypothetical protein